jgi:hypothetical protein
LLSYRDLTMGCVILNRHPENYAVWFVKR